VRTEGHGPIRVALVHGVVGSALGWHDLVAAARAADPGRHTFLLPDLRGHGDSARADRYRMTDIAGDLVETLPAGLDCVVGHSPTRSPRSGRSVPSTSIPGSRSGCRRPAPGQPCSGTCRASARR
jgi:hypothetical protein